MDKLKAQRKKDYSAYVAEKIKEFNSNGRLTVAIFCDAFFPSVDGVVMVVDNVARGISKKCNVVAFVPEHMGETVLRDGYLVIGVKSRFLKSLNYDAPSFFGLGALYRQTIKNLRIDIIHGHSPFYLGLAALSLHKKTGAPLVMTFHSQYRKDVYKETKSKILTAIAMKIIMKSFNGCTELWTMHKKSAETVQSYGYKGDIVFMPNATDYVYPPDAERHKAAIREHYAIGDAQKIFLFVGRLVTQKNILFIAEVLGRLRQKGLDFKMLFVGDGPDRKKLECKLAEVGVSSMCVFVGKISDKLKLESYYLAADLLLFPSKYDVSSIIQIEAAAMKTPCAFVEDSVTSCTVTGGVDGLILPEDVGKFADGVESLVTDKVALEKMSEAAYKNLYVTWGDVVEKTYGRYLYLAEKHKKQA